MATPTTKEAFVYCWTNIESNKLYVSVHKGFVDDGYICSSKSMLSEYHQQSQLFSRTIVAEGSLADMRALESAILQTMNAAADPMFYNLNNNDKNFFCVGHSTETRKKMSRSWKKRGVYNCNNEKAIAGWIGKKHSDSSKQLMREAVKKHKQTRSEVMIRNNPMKNPDSIKKMLEKRKLNKGLRHDTDR